MVHPPLRPLSNHTERVAGASVKCRQGASGVVRGPSLQSADEAIQRPTRTPSRSAGGLAKTYKTRRSADRTYLCAFRGRSTEYTTSISDPDFIPAY